MKDIFGQPIIKSKIVIQQPVISGLDYIPNWISEQEHNNLLAAIDTMPWETTLKRRVQQYGFLYDYRKAKNMTMSHKDNYLGELPLFLDLIAQRLFDEKIFLEKPDEVLVNEYLPGQGIAQHIDCLPCFSDTVVAISLGSQCIMDLKKDNEIVYKFLDKMSLLIIKGEARYEWSHGIRANKTDVINGKLVKRTRRVSVTFRKTTPIS